MAGKDKRHEESTESTDQLEPKEPAGQETAEYSALQAQLAEEREARAAAEEEAKAAKQAAFDALFASQKTAGRVLPSQRESMQTLFEKVGLEKTREIIETFPAHGLDSSSGSSVSGDTGAEEAPLSFARVIEKYGHIQRGKASVEELQRLGFFSRRRRDRKA